MLSVEIFERVGHQPILPEDHHGVLRSEDEVRQVLALQALDAAEVAQQALDLADRLVVATMFSEIVREIGAEVLDVELRLPDSVVAHHEIVEPRRPHHQYDLVLDRRVHVDFAPMISRSRSGDTLSWPILLALSASSRNASAMSWLGCMPTLARA